MNPTDYVQGALRTECDYGPVLERLKARPALVGLLLEGFYEGSETGQHLDSLKKTIFYGRNQVQSADGSQDTVKANQRVMAALKRIEDDPRLLRLAHSFLGKLTEAGELMSHLYSVLFSGLPLDEVNIDEETGDGFWYDAITSDTLQRPFEEIMGRNNAKLRARYPEKFTEECATVRDLTIERAVLEAPPIIDSPATDAMTEDDEERVDALAQDMIAQGGDEMFSYEDARQTVRQEKTRPQAEKTA